MTEQEWLGCDDLSKMLEFLRAIESGHEKRLRHFVMDCCHRVRHLLPNEAKDLLVALEHFGEGNATRHERDSAVSAFRAIHGRFGAKAPILRAVYCCKALSVDTFTATRIAADTALAVGDPVNELARLPLSGNTYSAERSAQVSLLRDIFGPLPFRLVTICPAWQTANVVSLAQAIYGERAFDRMPILGDALEEAGCDNADILNHCRQPGEHVRGCWVVDLVLGKQ
jgi:hypothetical protein